MMKFLSLNIILFVLVHITVRGNYIASDASEGSWLTYDGHSYKRFDDKKTWDNAWSDCKNYSSYLVVITSKDENMFIKNNSIQKPSNIHYWIGLAVNPNASGYHNQTFWWVEKEEYPQFTDWRENQPDNQSRNGNEYCAEINYEKQWNDAECNINQGYWCEREPASTSPTLAPLTSASPPTASPTPVAPTSPTSTPLTSASPRTTSPTQVTSTVSSTSTQPASPTRIASTVSSPSTQPASPTRVASTVSSTSTQPATASNAESEETESTTITWTTQHTTNKSPQEEDNTNWILYVIIAALSIIVLAGVAGVFLMKRHYSIVEKRRQADVDAFLEDQMDVWSEGVNDEDNPPPPQDDDEHSPSPEETLDFTDSSDSCRTESPPSLSHHSDGSKSMTDSMAEDVAENVDEDVDEGENSESSISMTDAIEKMKDAEGFNY